MIIAVDFDGTCVTHEYPKVGKDIGAQRVLKLLTDSGHKLVLFTMRSKRDDGTNPLKDAVDWFKKNNIPLWGININPVQKSWTKSPKAYAQLYIDDAALGCPLLFGPLPDAVPTEKPSAVICKPYVDWKKVERMLRGQNIIKMK